MEHSSFMDILIQEFGLRLYGETDLILFALTSLQAVNHDMMTLLGGNKADQQLSGDILDISFQSCNTRIQMIISSVTPEALATSMVATKLFRNDLSNIK